MLSMYIHSMAGGGKLSPDSHSRTAICPVGIVTLAGVTVNSFKAI
uniref:Uncharacterized protein n=1 Tax=Amphimedon queenslandica TaxID=400682 RepID=A0A1X7U1T1_AMPQE